MKTVYLEFEETRRIGVETDVSESEYRELSEACRKKHIVTAEDGGLFGLLEDCIDNAEQIGKSDYRIEELKIIEEDTSDYYED